MTGAIAYVTYSGTENVAGKFMSFIPDEEKWVHYGEFLMSFADDAGAVDSDFTVGLILYPDVKP